MMRWACLVILFWSTSSWALYKCENAEGVITYRDTPCPVTVTSSAEDNRIRFRVSAESAKLANQIRVSMKIEDAIKYLGQPVETASNGDNAWYRFRTPVADGLGNYEVELYTLDDKVTSISDEYRRLWARGRVWRGVSYETVLWTWGAPSEQIEEATDEGLKRTLVYDSNAKGGTLDTVYLLNEAVTEIEYNTRIK